MRPLRTIFSNRSFGSCASISWYRASSLSPEHVTHSHGGDPAASGHVKLDLFTSQESGASVGAERWG